MGAVEEADRTVVAVGTWAADRTVVAGLDILAAVDTWAAVRDGAARALVRPRRAAVAQVEGIGGAASSAADIRIRLQQRPLRQVTLRLVGRLQPLPPRATKRDRRFGAARFPDMELRLGHRERNFNPAAFDGKRLRAHAALCQLTRLRLIRPLRPPRATTFWRRDRSHLP